MAFTMRTDLVDSYVRYMRRRRLAPGTIDKRRSELGLWLAWIGPRWAVAERNDVEGWLDACGDLAPSTVYARVSHLHQFYRWAWRDALTDRDPTALIDRPRIPQRLPRPAPHDRASSAAAAAPDPVRVAMLLMIDGGLRCCEAAALTWGDVDLIGGTMHVIGKGGRHRLIGLPDRLRRVLYLEQDDDRAHVLGRRLAPHRVSHLVNRHLRSVGCGFTAHQLRHLYATRLYAATDGDLLIVQQALGHASVNSTQIYTHIDRDAVVSAARLLD